MWKRGEVSCGSRLELVGKSQPCMKRHERKGDENDGESSMNFSVYLFIFFISRQWQWMLSFSSGMTEIKRINQNHHMIEVLDIKPQTPDWDGRIAKNHYKDTKFYFGKMYLSIALFLVLSFSWAPLKHTWHFLFLAEVKASHSCLKNVSLTLLLSSKTIN